MSSSKGKFFNIFFLLPLIKLSKYRRNNNMKKHNANIYFFKNYKITKILKGKLF